jgi:hypothetical protein
MKQQQKIERLTALNVLNKHFTTEVMYGCLTDRQVKLVLDAMIEFRQFDVSEMVCLHVPTFKDKETFTGQNKCVICGEIL